MTASEYLANYAEILSHDSVIVTVDADAPFDDGGDSEPVAVIYAKLSTGDTHYRAWALSDGVMVGEGRA